MYNRIKAELTRRGENTRYFTRKFLITYLAALETIRENAEAGIDDGYYDCGIWTRHAWDEVRSTDFYLKDGGAYCVFLEIAHAWNLSA